MKKLLVIISLLIILIFSFRWFLYETNVSNDNNLSIVRKPDSVVFRRGRLDSLIKYTEKSSKNWERDFRCCDLSGFDFRNNLNELMHCDFDTKTIWPKLLPVGFYPDSIMELGKNPGLNVRKLHDIGITGKGVGVAIIDQYLLVDHFEYRNQLKMYEEIHVSKLSSGAQMHGPGVASILVGKTVGVAPDADLYYIASDLTSPFILIKKILFNKMQANTKWFAKSIYRILEINKSLPQEKKIRVISISFGSNDRKFLQAIKEANKEGVFVISSSLSSTHNLRFQGLGRDCLNNPDDINSYAPGKFWSAFFYNNPDKFNPDSILLIPMDSRCTASQSGNSSYVYYSNGGWSWSIPYIAGIYALACQVKQNVTPKEFWNKALASGDKIEIEKNNKKYVLGKIVNPVRLMESLKE
jgi:hypothetical protein